MSKRMVLKKQVGPPQLTPGRQLLIAMLTVSVGFIAAFLASIAFASFVADALAFP